MSRKRRTAEGQALDDAMASANPYRRDDVDAALPTGAHDLAIREIIDGSKLTIRERVAAWFEGFLTPAPWGRVGFVAVLAAVAIAVLAVNPGIFGQGEAGVTQPAEVGEAGETAEVDDDGPDAETETVVVEPPPTTTGVADESQDAASTSNETASGEPATADQQADSGADVETGPTSLPEPAPDQGSAVLSFGEPTIEPYDPHPNGNGGACLAVELEDMDLTGAWRLVSDDAAGGGAYAVWEGLVLGEENDSPADVLTVSLEVETAGTYRFVWSMRQPDEGAGDAANDSWVHFPDASRFGPIEGGTYGGFVKVYGNSKGRFSWTATADQGELKTQVAVQFDQPGTYTMEIAGRSHGHQLASIVLYQDSLSRDDAISGRCS